MHLKPWGSCPGASQGTEEYKAAAAMRATREVTAADPKATLESSHQAPEWK